MPKERIDKIISIVPKRSKDGNLGLLYTVEAGGDKATCWKPAHFKEGDTVNVFFNDKWHKAQFNERVRGFTLDFPDEARSSANLICERCGLKVKAEMRWR